MEDTRESLTRDSLAREVAAQQGVTLTDARTIVNTIVETIIGAVEDGRKVSLSGLITMTRRYQGARKHRNPATGEYFETDPKFVVRAKVSPVLAEKIAATPV